MVSRATARANDALAEHARLVAGPAAMEPAVVFNEVFAVGLSILDDVGVPLAGVDHRLMVRHFYAELIGDPDTRP
jgi:hypothetical protein